MTDKEIFMPQGKKVTVGGEEFTVMPFVLKNRTKAVRVIVDVVSELSKNYEAGRTENIAELATLIVNAAGERIVELYELVIPKPREWLESNVRLVDEVSIIEAVLEVNDVHFLAQRVRAMIKETKATTANS
jgi:hypothetical protein